jgi:hypothetical protein
MWVRNAKLARAVRAGSGPDAPADRSPAPREDRQALASVNYPQPKNLAIRM